MEPWGTDDRVMIQGDVSDTLALPAWRHLAARLWHTQRIKRLLRAALATEAVISVVELPCHDKGCPGPATRITVLGLDLMLRVHVVHCSAADVTAADIDSILKGLTKTPLD